LSFFVFFLFFLFFPQKSYADINGIAPWQCGYPYYPYYTEYCNIGDRGLYTYSSIASGSVSCASVWSWVACFAQGYPGACYTGSGGACISSQCGASSCGCAGLNPWAKYYPTCQATAHPGGGGHGSNHWISCDAHWVYSVAACSGANKCMSTQTSGDGYGGQPYEPYLRPGFCNCNYGNPYYTCCNSSHNTQLCSFYYGTSRDAYAPPEGTCGGATQVACGGSGRPACGQAACDTLRPAGWNVTVNVLQDTTQTCSSAGGYSGATVTVSPAIHGTSTFTTNSSGQISIATVPNGTYNFTLNVPTGYSVVGTCNPNSSTHQAIVNGANVAFTWYIHPPAPICTEGLVARPTSVNTIPPNNTSTLTATGCTAGGQGGTLTYSWPVPDLGTTANVNSPVTTYTAPNPYWSTGTAHPSVFVCQNGTTLCTPYGASVQIVPFFSIKGYVFVDQNKDAIKNSGESNYAGSPPLTISICPGRFCSSGGTPITATSGVFDTGYTLPAGTYTVSASGLPGGYSFTTTPPTLAPTTGNPCSPSNGSCDPNYNVYDLHFGISNSSPWIQTTGGDIYEKGGISNPIPSDTTCTGGSNMSISQNPIDFPGIVFTGNGLANFGQGFPSATLDNHWLVSGAVTFIQSQTSYASIKNKAQAANITPTALPCDSGSYANGCVMPNDLEPGVYIADGNLKLAGTGTPASYTFPDNSDYVILVNGTLDIETEIHFSANHNSTALFTAAGDITVGGDVGTADSTSTAPTIEGYYSAGGNFIVENVLNNVKNSNCPTVDKRLNIQGSIVANANGSGGSFQLKRDMCENDLCPTFSIQARPDFVLNAPLFYQSPTRIWQEMAP